MIRKIPSAKSAPGRVLCLKLWNQLRLLLLPLFLVMTACTAPRSVCAQNPDAWELSQVRLFVSGNGRTMSSLDFAYYVHDLNFVDDLEELFGNPIGELIDRDFSNGELTELSVQELGAREYEIIFYLTRAPERITHLDHAGVMDPDAPSRSFRVGEPLYLQFSGIMAVVFDACSRDRSARVDKVTPQAHVDPVITGGVGLVWVIESQRLHGAHKHGLLRYRSGHHHLDHRLHHKQWNRHHGPTHPFHSGRRVRRHGYRINPGEQRGSRLFHRGDDDRRRDERRAEKRRNKDRHRIAVVSKTRRAKKYRRSKNSWSRGEHQDHGHGSGRNTQSSKSGRQRGENQDHKGPSRFGHLKDRPPIGSSGGQHKSLGNKHRLDDSDDQHRKNRKGRDGDDGSARLLSRQRQGQKNPKSKRQSGGWGHTDERSIASGRKSLIETRRGRSRAAELDVHEADIEGAQVSTARDRSQARKSRRGHGRSEGRWHRDARARDRNTRR